MAELERRSALPPGKRVHTGRDVTLCEIEPVAKLRMQALRSRGVSSLAADPALLPASPNAALGTDPTALWCAPDDWLAYSRTLSAAAMTDWAATFTSQAALVVTDVSSASVVLELSGVRAVDVLMRDCSLDLEGDAVAVGACAQTLFAQTGVMIHRVAPQTWRLFVERSVAVHVWEWLVDASGPALASTR
jgi:sarcosine oxidase subunit gamma